MANDIAYWLEALGLGQYAGTFAQNDIDLSVLPHLSDEDLSSLGVSLGHRRKLKLALAANIASAHDSGVLTVTKLSAGSVMAAGERREVTIVFVDLAGVTALSTKADPEDVHELLGRYFEIVDRVLLDHGGHIDKHIGNAVMGVFGAPISHGNDTERAVRSAYAIQNALKKLSDDLGNEISAHIGIATGEVVASGTGSSVLTAAPCSTLATYARQKITRHPRKVTGQRMRSEFRLNLPAIPDVPRVEAACRSIQDGGSNEKARRHCDDCSSLHSDSGARLLTQQPQAIGPAAADHAARNPPAYPCPVDQQARGHEPRRSKNSNSGRERADMALVVRLFRRGVVDASSTPLTPGPVHRRVEPWQIRQLRI